MGACFGTWVAQVADLSVDKNTGKIKVHKVYVAVDCGPAVNPGPIVEQMESGVIMGLSTALKEQVKFGKGGVATSNYEDYPIIRMSEVPDDIEVEIIKSTDKIGGIGFTGKRAPTFLQQHRDRSQRSVKQLPSPGALVTAIVPPKVWVTRL